MSAADLELIVTSVGVARQAALDAKYTRSIEHYDVAIATAKAVVDDADPTTAAAADLLNLIHTLRDEKKQVQTTDVKDQRFRRTLDASVGVDARRPDSPPNDPAVWPAPPPLPSRPVRASSVNRQGGLNGHNRSGSQAAPNAKKRTVSASTLPPPGPPRKGSDKDKEKVSTPPDENVKKDDDEFFDPNLDARLVGTIRATMQLKDAVGSASFNEIAGLDDVKTLFQQVVVLPVLMPSFFTGIRRPWSGVLLYGPPGTGKTMLAKAVAHESDMTFFTVNISDLTSKWRGDSEQLISILFKMARHHAPSIIFIDEVESIASERGGANEHEASMRVKSQLLTEMDGFGSAAGVVVIAATNHPWLIDQAMRRRFEQRIYIGMPEEETRLTMLHKAFAEVKLDDDVRAKLPQLAKQLDGYSGADISIVCRTAAMAGIKRLLGTRSVHEVAALPVEDIDLPVTMDDVNAAFKMIAPSVTQDSIKRYLDWKQEMGTAAGL